MSNCCSKECEFCKNKINICQNKCKFCQISKEYIKDAFNIDEFSYDYVPPLDSLKNTRQYSV